MVAHSSIVHEFLESIVTETVYDAPGDFNRLIEIVSTKLRVVSDLLLPYLILLSKIGLLGFLELGLITDVEKDSIVSEAGQSDCGHK